MLKVLAFPSLKSGACKKASVTITSEYTKAVCSEYVIGGGKKNPNKTGVGASCFSSA